MKKKLNVLLVSSLFILSLTNTVYASSNGDAQTDIKSKANEIKQKVDNFNTDAEKKYPNRIDVVIPDEFVTKDYTLEQFGVKDTLQIGEFRNYMESQFQKSLNQYQSTYNGKKSELLNKYNSNKNQIEKNQSKDLSNYASTLFTLKSDYNQSVNDLENKYNQDLNSLKNNNKINNAKTAQELEKNYNEQIKKLQKDFPNDGDKFWNQAEFEKIKNNYQITNSQIQSDIAKENKKLIDAENFIKNIEQNMKNTENMDLKKKLNEIAPGFLDSYNPPKFKQIDLNSLKSPYSLPLFSDLNSKLDNKDKNNTIDNINKSYDIINSPEVQDVVKKINGK